MKKKHFAGVLMLTAAVALGTVSPVALPNTAVVVKAGTTYSFKTGADNTAYANIAVSVLEDGKIEVSGVTTQVLGNDHVFGYGADVSKAIDNALTKGTAIKSAENKFTAEVPSDAVVAVIVKKGDYTSTSTDVIGGQVSLAGYKQTVVDNTDYINTENKGQAIAKTVLQYRKEGTEAWEKIAADAKFPVTPVAEGTSGEYEVRKAAVKGASGTGKLISQTVKITITNQKQIGLEDLKALNYKIADTGIVTISGYKTNIKNITTKTGTVSYKIVATDTIASPDLSGATDFTATSDSETTAALTDGKSLVVFVKEKPEDRLVLDVKQAKKPEFEASTEKYELKPKTGYKVEGKYQIKKASGTYAEPNFEGQNIVVEGPNSGSTVKYIVKALGTKAGDVNFVDNKAEFTLSKEGDEVTVNYITGKIDATKFDAFTFTVDSAINNVTISGMTTALADVTLDKVKYTYGDKSGVLKKDDADVKLPITKGVLTLEVEGSSQFFKKEIDFVTVGETAQLKDSYTSPATLWTDLGGTANPSKGDSNTKYTIRAKGAAVAAADTVKYPIYEKTAVYVISREDSDKTAAGAVTVNNLERKIFKLKGEEEVYLMTEEDKKKQDKTLVKDAVVPVTGSTSGAKKEEPKKEEPKKEEPKKDDTKKEEPKKDDAKNTDNSSTTTDTKQPAQVDAKNTKSNSVSVSAEKIADALEGGLKVTGKSGEVKFAASAVKKVVGTEPVEVKVTLKTSVKKTTDKVVTKKLKGSKVLGGKVFALDLRVGNTAVKESKMKSTSVTVTLKANLGKAKKTVYVLDLSSGKRVKATYKNGKVTFKTKYLGRFVIVNKAK